MKLWAIFFLIFSFLLVFNTGCSEKRPEICDSLQVSYSWENRPSFLTDIIIPFNNNEIYSYGASFNTTNWAILHIKVDNTTKSKISNIYLDVKVTGGAEKLYFMEVSSPKNAYDEAKNGGYTSNKLSIRTSSKNIGPGVNQSWYVVVVSQKEDPGDYTISVEPQRTVCNNLKTTIVRVRN